MEEWKPTQGSGWSSWELACVLAISFPSAVKEEHFALFLFSYSEQHLFKNKSIIRPWIYTFNLSTHTYGIVKHPEIFTSAGWSMLSNQKYQGLFSGNKGNWCGTAPHPHTHTTRLSGIGRSDLKCLLGMFSHHVIFQTMCLGTVRHYSKLQGSYLQFNNINHWVTVHEILSSLLKLRVQQ